MTQSNQELATAVTELQAAIETGSEATTGVNNAFAVAAEKAIQVAREAFSRVLPDAELQLELDDNATDAALPHTADNIRIDHLYPNGDDSNPAFAQPEMNLVDSETGTSFRTFRVDGPIAGVHFQVRVPISKVLDA